MEDQKRRQIALSVLPFVLYLAAFPSMLFGDSGAVGMLIALAGSLAGLAVLVYWTTWVRDDPTVSGNERIIWWLLLWFGNVMGLGFFLYYRVWLGRTLGIGEPEPVLPDPDDVPFDAPVERQSV